MSSGPSATSLLVVAQIRRVREVVDAPQHGGGHADAEGGLLRGMLVRPLLLLAHVAATGELPPQPR